MATLLVREAPGGACTPAMRVTRSLLGYGLIAGPFYVAVVLVQAAIRNGFDLARDDASLLSNGDLGWIQIVNFLLTGAMVIACAAGMTRALKTGPGATWAPRLLAGYGLGLIGAGVFVADPMNGFPPGTAAGRTATLSTHGILHLALAGIGFFCLVAACVMFARRFLAERQARWAAFSLLAGALFLAGFGGLASGSSSPAVVIFFWAALIIAWAWIGSVALHVYRSVPSA